MKDYSPVAVASRSFSRHFVLRKELLDNCANVTFNDAGCSLRGPKLIEFLRGHEKAIIALEVLDEEVFRAVPELRVVSKYGVGMDSIDLDAMERHGVMLGWTGGVNKRSVTELVVAFAICLMHRVPQVWRDLEEGTWRQLTGRQLTGKVVGIIGCGHIGKDVATMLRIFDCTVLAHDILDFPEFYAMNQVRPVQLEVLLRASDVVTLHLPLDESTTNILNAERLELMKPGAFLINAARGGLVDEETLKRLLRDGHLAGAAFDVFASEPPTDTELLRLPNFIGTPHIGGSTEEAILAMGRAAIQGLSTYRPAGIVKSVLRAGK